MLEDVGSVFVFDQEPSPLSRHNPYLGGVRIAEAIKHSCHGAAEGFVQESPPIVAEQIRAGVFVRHPLALMLDTVSALIVFEVVLKTVEDSGQVLGLFPVAEGDQFEQRVKGQWRQRQCWATFDLPSGGHSAQLGRSLPC